MARWTQEVARVGAKAVWHPVTADDDWPRLLELMRGGDERALRLGLQVCSAADTDPGEELLDVLAEATKAHPRLVLEHGGQCVVGFRDLCGWMSAHSTVGESREAMLTEMRLRRAGVESVQEAALAESRAGCLQGIADVEQRYREPPTPTK